MSFTQSSHIIVTFDEYNVPDKKSVGSEFNGANIAKEIWFAFTDETLINYTVVVNAKRADGDLGYRLCEKKTVDGVAYDYLKLDSWFTEKVGKVILAVKVYKSSDITINEDGTYTLIEDEPLIVVGDLFHLVVNYAPNADSLVAPFDPSDMQVIMATIGNKSSKSEVPLIVTSLPSDLDTLIDGVYKYDGWFFMLTDGTLYRIDDDTATFIGKIGESVKYVKSSEILAKGDVVQLDTATGGFVQVKKAVPSEINARPQLVLGLAMQAFTAHGFGLILMQGYLSGIDTSSATADGDVVYFDSGSASNGLFTMTRPTPPNAIIILGTVSNAAVNGSIDVRITSLPLSTQIIHNETPINYSASTKTVHDHLAGIDTKIGTIDLRTIAGLLVKDNPTATQLTAVLNEATTLLKGLMSATDKSRLDTLYALLSTSDGNNVVDTVGEVLAIFNSYPEGVSVVTALAGKVASSDTTFTDGVVMVQDGSTEKKIKQSTIASSKLTTTDDTSSVDSTIVVQDGTSGKKYKKSEYTPLTLPISNLQQTALDLKTNKLLATNVATNSAINSSTSGHFISGTGTMSASGSELTFTASVQNSSLRNTYTSISNHKYYYAVSLKADSASVRVVLLNSSPITSVYHTGSGTYERLAIYAVCTTSSGTAFASCYDGRTSGWTANLIKQEFIFDATAFFGAGNEPKTKSEIESILSYLGILDTGFNGTLELITPMYLYKNKLDIANDFMYGKTLAIAGTSITAAVNPAGGNFYSYGDLIALRHNMTYYNYGIGGSTMTEVSGKNPFVGTSAERTAGTARYQVMTSSIDYLLIEFAWNDIAYATLGTISDTGYTTFYGAYKNALTYLKTKYPNAFIGLIVSYAPLNATSDSFKQAVRDMGKMFGLPVFDYGANNAPLVYDRPGVDSTITALAKSTYLYDGTHPNQTGYTYIAKAMESFIKYSGGYELIDSLNFGYKKTINLTASEAISTSSAYFDVTGSGTFGDPYVVKPKTTIYQGNTRYVITADTEPASNIYINIQSADNQKCIVTIKHSVTFATYNYIVNALDINGKPRWRVTYAGTLSNGTWSTANTWQLTFDVNSAEVYSSSTY